MAIKRENKFDGAVAELNTQGAREKLGLRSRGKRFQSTYLRACIRSLMKLPKRMGFQTMRLSAN